MQIILLRSKSTSPTEVVNFLILVTFKIKDFKGHYLKLVVLRCYTNFRYINIHCFIPKYVQEGIEHINN